MTVGLDIGRRTVKLVRVEASRRVLRLGPRPSGEALAQDAREVSVKGTTRELDPSLEGTAARAAVVEAIRECAAELGVGREPVAISVPRAEAVLKTVLLPPVPAEERARLIRFQAAKDVPFELADVVLASGVVGAAPSKEGEAGIAGGSAIQTVNYAAVRTSVLDSLRGLVREAGLVPGALEISTQAAARAARLLAPEAPDAVLILVGALASEIVLLKQGRISFSRSASVGFAGEPGETGWLDKLVAEVQRSLRAANGGPAAAYWGGLPAREGALAPSWTEDEEAPRALLLAGGGLKDPNVAATLAARLGIPARTLEPLGAGSSPSFLVARGLADPRPVEGIPVLDFAGLADAAAARSLRQRLTLGGGLALALVFAAGVLGWNQLVRMERESDDLEKEVRRLKPDADAVKKLLREVTVAQDWEKRKGRSLEVLLAISKALPQDDAYLTRLQWSEGKTILITGRVRDQVAVEKFHRQLGRDPIVERATLDFLRLSGDKPDPAKGLEFGLTAKLHELPGEKAK